MSVKDPTGVFMRLLWKAWIDRPDHNSLTGRKIFFAMRTKIDEKIQEYFHHHPDQRPGLQNPPNRLGLFMRRVAEWRRAEKEYYSVKTEGGKQRLFTLHKTIGEDMESYFQQKPHESPEDLWNPKQPTLFDLEA